MNLRLHRPWQRAFYQLPMTSLFKRGTNRMSVQFSVYSFSFVVHFVLNHSLLCDLLIAKKWFPPKGCFSVLFLIISLFSFFHFDSARIQISGMNWNIIQRQHVTSLSHFQKTAAEHFREEVRLGICVDKPGFGAINLKLVPAFSIRFLRFIQVFLLPKGALRCLRMAHFLTATVVLGI